MASVSAIDSAIQGKMYGRSFLMTGNGVILVDSSEDVDDVIRIIKSLEKSSVFYDRGKRNNKT